MATVFAVYSTQLRLAKLMTIKRCLCDIKAVTPKCYFHTLSSTAHSKCYNSNKLDCNFRMHAYGKRLVSSLVRSSILRAMENDTYYFSTNLPPVRNKNTDSHTSDTNNNKSSSIDEFRAREEEKEQQEYLSSMKSSSDDSDYEDKSDDEKIKDLRLKILDASLCYVGTYGWTRKTIAKGAESLNYPGVIHGMFPDGGIELIRHFYSKCNNQLLEQMIRDTKNGEHITDKPLEFLVNAVKIRLQMIEPYLNQWPQALAIMSLPQNVPTSLAQLLTLVDDICYYSGDRSVDFGWYTRRIGLATIYKMTELYMLQDSSVNHEETWNFLQKRMEDASNFEALVLQSEGLTHNMQQKLNSAFETARNILGLDYNRR